MGGFKDYRYTIFILAMLSGGWAFGQTVPSSCKADESVEAMYEQDAHRLALRRILANELEAAESVEIPQAHVDTAMNALLAVYNALELPARDTVVEMFGIHSFPAPPLHAFVLSIDPAFSWTDSLALGAIPTGNSEVDGLIAAYGLVLTDYYDYNDLLDFHAAVFETVQPSNLFALGALFVAIDGVNYSEPNYFYGDGNDITSEVHSDHVELTYSYGWGDCQSGCKSRRFWQFRVYFDCSVAYVGSFGDVLYTLSTVEGQQARISAFPNPFTDQLTIEGLDGHVVFNIVDMKGSVVKVGFTENGTISGLDNLAPGLYLLNVMDHHSSRPIRIMKQAY